jgi:hypothetical protein
MDRHGKKPKATHDDAPDAERSDTKAHIRDETESTEIADRVAAEKAEADEHQALVNQGHKGPQHLE